MRLITYGCSFTYGTALPDMEPCQDKKPWAKPSTLSWPSILHNMLGTSEYQNHGMPGASNREIWWRALNNTYNKTDIVVFQWTWNNRYCFVNEDVTDIYQLTLNNGKSRREFWPPFVALAGDYDRNTDMFLLIDHIDSKLKSQNITPYHFIIEHTNIPTWCNAKIHPINIYDMVWSKYPSAKDDVHPGDEAHAITAKILEDFIKKDVDK